MLTNTIDGYTINVFILKRAKDRYHCEYGLHKDGRVILTGTFDTPSYWNHTHLGVTALCNATVMIGDTDREYFDTYTPSELEWAQSNACDELSCTGITLGNEECSECGYWLYETAGDWDYDVLDDGKYVCNDCKDYL